MTALLDRIVLSLVNGLSYVRDGASRPTMGSCAREVIYKRGKLELSRVHPIGVEEFELGHAVLAIEKTRHATPVLLVPPLMVRPYVYDLRPEHSLMRTLRNAGFDVYVVDFGVPDPSDEHVRLDDYVLDWVPTCVERTCATARTRSVSMVGYCMGGIFSLLQAGTFRDGRVKNIVTIGAPIDFRQMGVITAAARLGVWSVDIVLDRLGNVPGKASSLGFQMLSGTRALTRWVDLLINLWKEEYVRGFSAIDAWINDLIPYPKEAFKQLVKEVVYENKLLRNELVFGDKRCDFKQVDCPLLAFAGQSDNVATPEATRAIVDLVGSTDKTLVPVPGGHVGVIAGADAPRCVWGPMVDWLAERS